MRRYPSKLLLFGEHVLLLGSTALAVPVHEFGGSWVLKKGVMQDDLWHKMMQFARSPQLLTMPFLDTLAFIRDLENGWVFDSNIPIGYGLGSSGAFCAAVYDRYALEKTEDLSTLKTIFSSMESFFHGASSGIDPLTSYVQKPLLIQNKSNVSMAVQQPWEYPPVCFLLDTTLARQTEPLVKWFLAKSQTPVFEDKLNNEYLPVHEQLVQSWLQGDEKLFWNQLRAISLFQLDYFIPMVPDSIRPFWEAGLHSGAYTLKICGAGGGGFMLGFCRNEQDLGTLSPHFNLRILQPLPAISS